MDGVLQGATTGLAWLEVIGGPAKGHRIPVQGEIRFGRDEAGEGSLGYDAWLSPAQALIRHGEHGWTVEDLRSLEGTRVNGTPVRGATVLREGDTIEIGSSRLLMAPPNGPAEPPRTDLAQADLRPVWRKRRRAWVIDRLLLLPVASAIGFLAEGRQAVVLAYTALMLSYHFLCEALTGQTLGKALVGIRVVDVHGRPLRPAKVAARALLLLVDTVLVGLISIAFSGKRQQRLGDIAAGTVVAPADNPFVPSRSRLDRLTLWFYPLAWLAPCVLLFLFAPWASAPTCKESQLRGEGLCRVGHRVVDVRAAGHATHLDGFDADLVATRSREMRNGGRLVSFRIELTNKRDTALRPRSEIDVTLGLLDDSGEQFNLRAHRYSKLREVAPGESERIWVRYAVPPEAVQGLPFAPSHLTVMNALSPERVGWISLWHYAGEDGVGALRGLGG